MTPIEWVLFGTILLAGISSILALALVITSYSEIRNGMFLMFLGVANVALAVCICVGVVERVSWYQLLLLTVLTIVSSLLTIRVVAYEIAS